jgi:hypothetical protein
MTSQREYIEMLSQLPHDTFLNIKYENNGLVSWCKYWIPTNRKDNTPVLFGELYQYFSQKAGFKFALGYIGLHDPDGKHYIAYTQYFGFTKTEPPHFSVKKLEHALILPKYNHRSKG